MKLRNNSFAKTVALALTLAIMSLPAIARHGGHVGGDQMGKDHGGKIHVGKRGEVNFKSDTRVGDALLPAGAYQFQHIVEGDDHVAVFKKAGTGKGVARVKCMIEPLGEKAKQTTIYSAKNAAGENVIQQILVGGENVKHVF